MELEYLSFNQVPSSKIDITGVLGAMVKETKKKKVLS
jgi:hypothetical protein